MSDIVRFPCGHVSTKLELESARFSECLSCQSKRGQQTNEAPQAGCAAGALPGEAEVEAALNALHLQLPYEVAKAFNELIRAHLSQLTAERDALRSRLFPGPDDYAALEYANDRARVEALRWAIDGLDRDVPRDLLLHKWRDEIVRLESIIRA